MYMIGQPAAPLLPPPILPPQPEHEPLPRQPPRVEREYLDSDSVAQYGPPRPQSRMALETRPRTRGTSSIGMTLPNSSLSSESEQELLDVRDVSGPGRSRSARTSVNNEIEQRAHTNDPARQSHQRAPSTASGSTGTSRASSDRKEPVQPPPYNEATERISIFIDVDALQAIQGSSESFSMGFLEKIRAARDQYHLQGTLPNTYYPAPQPFTPRAQTIHRPLPPLPITARPDSRRPEENVESGYVHHRSSVILPMHQSAFNDMAALPATPDRIPARADNWAHSCSAPEHSPHKCECTLDHHPQFRLSVLEPHSSHPGKSIPSTKHAYRPQPAATSETALSDTVDLHLHLTSPQQPCNLTKRMYTELCGQSEASKAPPSHHIATIALPQPPQLDATAEESLHVDELNVAERKPLSKMEKALLRRIEFGLKVDYSILQLT